MSKKSSLRKHLQMLQVFADAYARMIECKRNSLYEAHLCMVDEFGCHYKVFRYFIGSSILPDSISSACDDIYITLLKDYDIKHYIEECDKYEIKANRKENLS